MSLRNSVRALPTLMRVGFSEAVAYRAEMLVWILATTMPFIMLALWTAVARDEPVVAQSGATLGQGDFVAYFLSTFIVRQLTSSWAAWEMNFEVRQGTLSMRLLRPISPILSYAVENVAAIPMRLVVAIPVAVIALVTVGTKALPSDPGLWALYGVSLLGSWLITFLANVAIGSLAFFMQSSIKVMDVWLALYFVFSGYLIPVELFPRWLSIAANLLPFRYQIGLPVELMSGRLSFAQGALLVLQQWAFVGLFFALATLLWRRGVRRFAAFGG